MHGVENWGVTLSLPAKEDTVGLLFALSSIDDVLLSWCSFHRRSNYVSGEVSSLPKICRAPSSDRLLRLENNQNGELQYVGGLVSEIKGVNVNKCNMSFVEAMFLGLGYNRYNEIYWLEPGFDLHKGLRLLQNDYDSLRMRESTRRKLR
ncbi:hypothetical protein PIB30_042897 [Stylosanthes scabra]|uniref:PB1-like domain-containing protein n=1 Tax=Stylosanthes scabra TaxID=79078 RepID=A0ABU6SG33_9FABA|nr:hypothetical protein [Stylosanthes scabra]